MGVPDGLMTSHDALDEVTPLDCLMMPPGGQA